MPNFPVRRFQKGQVIFNEGTRGDVAFVLRSGSVEISAKADGEKAVLAKLTPPAVFGDMALLLGEPKRTATATALEPCELVEIQRQAFDEFLEQSPKVISTLLTALASRLRETNAKAARVPDLFLGVAEVIHMISLHSQTGLSYAAIVEGLTSAFAAGEEQVKHVIGMMADCNLIEMDGAPGQDKTVEVLGGEKFIDKARKVHEALKRF